MLNNLEDFKRARDALARGFVKNTLWGVVVSGQELPSWSELTAMPEPKVRFCIHGALMFASKQRDFSYSHPWIKALDAQLPREYKADGAFPIYDLVAYNNHPDTTQTDVVALFDRVIAEQENVDG